MGLKLRQIQYSWERFYGKEHGPWHDGTFWTQERKDQLLNLRNQNKSPKEAAEVIGCSETAIYQTWQSFYSKELGCWGEQAVWPRVRKDQLLVFRNEGKSQKQAAEVMGCSKEAVSNAWQRCYSKEYGPWEGL